MKAHIEALFTDVRYAFRQFRRSPGFAATAILTVALGVGANTAIFSVIDAVLLRPLPYRDSGRLLFIWESGQPRTSLYSFSYPRLQYFQTHLRSFTAVAGYDDEIVTFSAGGEPEQIEGGRVSSEFFSVLGVSPAMGRAFTAAEDRPGGAPVAILSHRLWQRSFRADPAVIGRTVRLDGGDYTILGVMPADFQFLGEKVEVWRPRLFETGTYAPASIRLGATFITVVGRLRPGAALGQAQAEIAIADAQYKKENPGNSDLANVAYADLLANRIFSQLRLSLYVLWGAVTCLLLIACANVGNLLLSRAFTRRNEMAARLALGATRPRIVQQLLCESVILSLCGGVAALPLARGGVDLLVAILRQTTPQVPDVRLNPMVLAFTMLVCLCTGLAFGAAPIWISVRHNLARSQRGGSESIGARRFRGVLVAGEVALCMVLLAGAGLLGRSLMSMRGMDPGIRTERVVVLPLTLMKERYEKWDARTAFYREVLRRVSEVPGISAAGITSRVDLAQNGLGYLVLPEGWPDRGPRNAGARGRSISPEYLKVLGIPVLRGRGIDAHDSATAPRVMLVNETFARRFFPGQEPIGKHVTYSTDRIVCEIVGVVRDVRSSLESTTAAEEFYLPLTQRPWLTARLVARVAGDLGAGAAAIRREVHAIDAEQAVDDVRLLSENLERGYGQRRTTLSVVGAFAGVALLLAAVGIYGVLSYSVTQRSREIAIRMALGAAGPAMQAAIVRQSMRLVLAGAVAGVPATIALARLYGSLLFQVSPADPVSMALAMAGLVAVALVASYLPARRAAGVDPALVLRGE